MPTMQRTPLIPTNEVGLRSALSGAADNFKSFTYNMFALDSKQKKLTTPQITHRPGIVYSGTLPNATARIVKGGYFWPKNNTAYAVVLDAVSQPSLVRDGIIILTAVTMGLGNGFREANFVEYTEAGVDYLLCSTGAQLWRITTAHAVTQVVDADLPNPHLPFPIAMDGYVFLAAANSNAIFNCELENVLSWTANGVIEAERTPGNLIGIAKHRNRILALKRDNIEVFKNIGNPPPNSPLQRENDQFYGVGVGDNDWFQAREDVMYFIGNSSQNFASDTDVGFSLYELKQFQLTEITDGDVRQFVNACIATGNTGVNIADIQGQPFVFFGLIDGPQFSEVSGQTLVYNIASKDWNLWGTKFCDSPADNQWGQQRNPFPILMASNGRYFWSAVTWNGISAGAGTLTWTLEPSQTYDTATGINSEVTYIIQVDPNTFDDGSPKYLTRLKLTPRAVGTSGPSTFQTDTMEVRVWMWQPGDRTVAVTLSPGFLANVTENYFWPGDYMAMNCMMSDIHLISISWDSNEFDGAAVARVHNNVVQGLQFDYHPRRY